MIRSIKIIIKIVSALLSLTIFLLIVGYLFLNFYPGVGRIPNKKMREVYKEKTKLYDGKRFHNLNDVDLMTGKYNKNKKAKTAPDSEIEVIKWDEYPSAEDNEFTINWLGHSSSLIQLGGQNILIDPVLTTYASPVSFIGAKRFSDIPITPDAMPHIDVLLISHDHYDHLDYETIKQIDSKVDNYIVPLGVESYLYAWGIDKKKVHSLAWWEDIKISSITYTSTPAQHYSGRNPLKKDAAWWTGYYFTNGINSIYFTGDSGYMEDFKDISSQLGDVDVLLADSGQYNDAWSKIHMNPKEALQLANDVNAKYYIPIHWGTFVLSDHDWNASPKIATENAVDFGVTVITPKIGEKVTYEEIEKYQEKWWQ